MARRRSQKKQLWPSPDPDKHSLPQEFNQAVLQKVRSHILIKDLLYLLVVGFRQILSGFIKPSGQSTNRHGAP